MWPKRGSVNKEQVNEEIKQHVQLQKEKRETEGPDVFTTGWNATWWMLEHTASKAEHNSNNLMWKQTGPKTLN